MINLTESYNWKQLKRAVGQTLPSHHLISSHPIQILIRSTIQCIPPTNRLAPLIIVPVPFSLGQSPPPVASFFNDGRLFGSPPTGLNTGPLMLKEFEESCDSPLLSPVTTLSSPCISSFDCHLYLWVSWDEKMYQENRSNKHQIRMIRMKRMMMMIGKVLQKLVARYKSFFSCFWSIKPMINRKMICSACLYHF